MGFVTRIWKLYGKCFLILSVPLILLFLFFIPDETLSREGNQCLYVMILMGVFWCTEALPITVTGLLPIVVFPSMGILPVKEVCANYFKDSIMMVFGAMIVALAVEKCHLHKRMAISALYAMGTKPLWLMLGFMLPTWFLSMWTSNTATTAMMLPIAESVIDRLEKSQQEIANQCDDPLDSTHEETTFSTQSKTAKARSQESKKNMRIVAPKYDNFAKGLTMAIAYAANTGGIASLTGTIPNIVLKSQADDIWSDHGFDESPVNFASWFVLGLPISAASGLIVWLWITAFHAGFRCSANCTRDTQSRDDIAIRKAIDKEYTSLGRLRFAEVMVSVMFALLVLLWFFQSPGFMTGWADNGHFKQGYMGGAVVSIFIGIVLCAVPSEFRRPTNDTGRESVDMLMDWNTIEKNTPFGALLLVGGGVTMAKASHVSGLSVWIADQLSALSALPDWTVMLILCLFVTFLTEIASNTAVCTLSLPIAASIAKTKGINPLYLMLPVSICSSFAFMLPVATPPNILAYSTGRLKTIDMIKTGFVLNICCCAVAVVITYSCGHAYYDFSTLPWANNTQIFSP